eukprot:5470850-Pleurochrysis_carterae.AAC.3
MLLISRARIIALIAAATALFAAATRFNEQQMDQLTFAAIAARAICEISGGVVDYNQNLLHRLPVKVEDLIVLYNGARTFGTSERSWRGAYIDGG